jgi:hypothetical protein
MKNEVNKPITSVNSHLGTPVFMIDGQPFMKPVFETYVPETKYFKEFADAGCHVYSFSTNLADGFGPSLWIAPEEWDFTELDARAHRVLEAKKDGLIMPRILLRTGN